MRKEGMTNTKYIHCKHAKLLLLYRTLFHNRKATYPKRNK